MYFAVLGKNPTMSREELKKASITNIQKSREGIVLFDTAIPEALQTLGGIIKRGRVVADIGEELKDSKIFACDDAKFALHIKRTYGIRRYKITPILSTDKEIKEKGKEIIELGKKKYGIVDGYQNIGLYESIDFEKPARSMQMGMMPAKLTHIMINI